MLATSQCTVEGCKIDDETYITEIPKKDHVKHVNHQNPVCIYMYVSVSVNISREKILDIYIPLKWKFVCRI